VYIPCGTGEEGVCWGGGDRSRPASTALVGELIVEFVVVRSMYRVWGRRCMRGGGGSRPASAALAVGKVALSSS